jgi:very-short-patch-repair endonuclease
MNLTIYKNIILNGHVYNILKSNDIYLFDLLEFSIIHNYNKNYLINYYGKQKKYIKIYHKKYTDWNGIMTICHRARHEVTPSFNLIKRVINNSIIDIDIPLSDERKYIKQIKEYFGNRYEYIEQFPDKKWKKIIKSGKCDFLISELSDRYRIDLVIMRNNKIPIFIEIDEDHHKYQHDIDQKREECILLSYNCNLVRLKLYDKTFNFQNSLDQINTLLND